MAISKPTKTSRKGKAVQPTKKVVAEEPTTDPESPISSESDEIPVIKKVIKKKIIRKKVVKKPTVTKDTAKSKKPVKSKKKAEPTTDVDEEDKSQQESQEEPETQESEPEISSQESEVEKSPEKPKRKATKAPKLKAISQIKKHKSTLQAKRQNIAEPDTQESSGTESPGPKVSEQDILSIQVPNHIANDPSRTMNEMVFNAIKIELSENGKDTFTYQSIEKRMKIEGSDTVRKCIKAFLEEGVLENKKKSKKFIGKMQGQLELIKGNYYEALEQTTEQLINDVLPGNHLEETFTVKDLNDEVPKASSTAKKPTRAAASKTKAKSSKKVAAAEPKKIEQKEIDFSEENDDSETNDEQVSIPIVAPPTPPRKKVVKKTRVDAVKNKRRRSRSIVISKTNKKLPTKKLEKEKKVEKKVARGKPTRARKEVVEESD